MLVKTVFLKEAIIASFRNTVFTNMVYDYLTANNKIAEKVISKAERDAKIAEASKTAKEA